MFRKRLMLLSFTSEQLVWTRWGEDLEAHPVRRPLGGLGSGPLTSVDAEGLHQSRSVEGRSGAPSHVLVLFTHAPLGHFIVLVLVTSHPLAPPHHWNARQALAADRRGLSLGAVGRGSAWVCTATRRDSLSQQVCGPGRCWFCKDLGFYCALTCHVAVWS